MLQQRDDHLNTYRPFYHQSFKESHLFYTVIKSLINKIILQTIRLIDITPGVIRLKDVAQGQIKHLTENMSQYTSEIYDLFIKSNNCVAESEFVLP